MAKARPRPAAPPPARRTPPKSQGSPVLIIFLVFFILISLTLGTFLYLAQDKIANADTNAKKANEEKKKAMDDYVDLQSYYDKQMRVWVDPGTVNPQERQDLDALDQKFATSGNDPRSKEFKSIKDILEGGGGGKGLIGKPDASVATTYVKGLVELLRKQLEDERKGKETAQNEFNSTKKKFEDYQKEWNAERYQRDWKKAQEELETKLNAKIEEKNRAIEAHLATIDSVKKDMEQRLTDEKAKFAAEKKLVEARVQDEIEKVNAIKRDISDRYTAEAKVVFDKDAPRVTRVDPKSDILFIDVGEGERVYEGLTFNVYKPGPGGMPNVTRPDASIKVISVLGKGLSQARITRISKPEQMRLKKDGTSALPEDEAYWFTDPRDFWKTRAPVQVGDLLNNPAWSRNRTVHLYLAGIFDLDGDGHDDLNTVRRMMREMGAEVDGYLDPTNEHAPKGRLDYQTDLLVIGDVPVGGGKNAGSKLQESARTVEDDAKKKGIRVLRIQNFLTEMGFDPSTRLPSGRNGNGNGRAAPAAAPKADQPKDEPKEEEKKPAKKPVKEEEDKKDK